MTLYDPKTVSEILDVPTSTLRRYSVEWTDYLSEQARAVGKKRRYTADDLALLRKIRSLTVTHASREVIISALQMVEEPAQDVNALALLPQIAQEFESLRALIAQQADELQAMRARLEAIEAERSRSWWDRIRGK